MIRPSNQTKLFGYNKMFNELINLNNEDKLPNKILLSGQKGLGKCTFSYHLVNSILSKNEEFSYDLENFFINPENKSFKLIQNKSHPNFNLIDVLPEKKNIDIDQVRQLLSIFNKSSFNSKQRFILIDNIEYLNKNSTNALLKFLEEPSDNTFFILIHNHKEIPNTLKSRCLEYKIFFTNKEMIDISNRLLENNIFDLINNELLNYYFTPGKIYYLFQFSVENKINLKNITLNEFLSLLIDKGFYKKDTFMNILIYDFVEFFLCKNFQKNYFSNTNDYLVKINNMKKFNLDEESFFIDFKEKILNG